MPNELPYETYQRLTGQSWNDANRNAAYQQYGINLPQGSAEANLALQRAMTSSTPSVPPSSITPKTEVLKETTPSLYQQPDTSFYSRMDKPTLSREASFQEPNETQIREQKMREAQARLASVENIYGERIRQEQELGKKDLGRTRSVQAIMGMSGAPQAETAMQGSEARTTQRVQYQNELKAQAINAIYDKIDENVQQEKEYQLGLDKEQYEEDKKKVALQAQNILADLGKQGGGVTFQEWQKVDPQYAENLRRQSGLTQYQIDELWNRGIPEAMKPFIHESVINKDGEASIQRITYNPRTKAKDVVEFSTGTPYTEYVKGEKITRGDGSVVLLYPDGSFKEVMPATESEKADIEYKRAQAAKLRREAVSGGVKGLTLYQQFQGGITLGGKIDKLTQAAKEALNKANLATQAFERYKKGETKDLNATTQVIINNFNKILDPVSVVRESEYARSPAGQSLLGNIEGKLNKLSQGGAGLTKESLSEFVELGNLFAKNAQKSIDIEKQRAINYAQKFGLDTSYIGGGYIPSLPEEEQQLQVGSVVDDVSNLPDGTTITDDEGNSYLIQNGQAIPQE